jgi:hypothetical protein
MRLPAVSPQIDRKSCLEAMTVCRQAAGEFPANAGHLQAQAIGMLVILPVRRGCYCQESCGFHRHKQFCPLSDYL